MGRFCILEYRPRAIDEGQTLPRGEILLIAIQDSDGDLHFFVPRDLQTIVAAPDLSYVNALFTDLHQRAYGEGDALFEQLTSLSVGPLTTKMTGDCKTNNDYLQLIWPTMVPLEPTG
jgi:hypothetical protein